MIVLVLAVKALKIQGTQALSFVGNTAFIICAHISKSSHTVGS